MAEETTPVETPPAEPPAPTPVLDQAGFEAAQQRAVQAALQASQEQAVRQCLGALDPTTRTDEGTYADCLRRLQTVCQTHLDRLTTAGDPGGSACD